MKIPIIVSFMSTDDTYHFAKATTMRLTGPLMKNSYLQITAMHSFVSLVSWEIYLNIGFPSVFKLKYIVFDLYSKMI